MEDLGPLKHLLGMKIETVGSSTHVTQGIYLEKILSSYGIQNVRTVDTPFVPNTWLLPATTKERKDFIGFLIYLAVSTHPDILFAMLQLSHFLENPGSNHCAACIHILCYLRGTPSKGLTLGPSIS
jgi:hypothetical protein